jgi:hypothetical protein
MSSSSDDAGDRRDRRQGDRRGTIDLTRPRYLERRQHRDARRQGDKEWLEQNADLLSAIAPPAGDEAPQPPQPSKSLAELEADFQALQTAMDRRNRLMRDLPAAEFEAVQTRDEELLTRWTGELRRLEAEIAAARRDTAE